MYGIVEIGARAFVLTSSVEWIRVRPRILRNRGRILPSAVDDIESAFLAVLHDIGIPHRKRGDCIEIFGYAESAADLHR